MANTNKNYSSDGRKTGKKGLPNESNERRPSEKRDSSKTQHTKQS